MDMKETMLGVIIGFVVLIVGLALTPTVGLFVTGAQDNISAASASLLPVVEILWIIAIVMVSVSVMFVAVKGI